MISMKEQAEPAWTTIQTWLFPTLRNELRTQFTSTYRRPEQASR